MHVDSIAVQEWAQIRPNVVGLPLLGSSLSRQSADESVSMNLARHAMPCKQTY